MMTDPVQPIWNSLEIVKLVASLITPVLILVFGIWVTQIVERFKASIWANQKVVEKRIEIYDELAPLLNDIYCYFYFIGNWKELSPRAVIDIKRKLDKKVFVYSPLFSPNFLPVYQAFIALCFEHYVGAGLDARLRTSVDRYDDRRSSFPGVWDKSWDSMFSAPAEQSDQDDVRKAYERLMTAFSSELGIVGSTR